MNKLKQNWYDVYLTIIALPVRSKKLESYVRAKCEKKFRRTLNLKD